MVKKLANKDSTANGHAAPMYVCYIYTTMPVYLRASVRARTTQFVLCKQAAHRVLAVICHTTTNGETVQMQCVAFLCAIKSTTCRVNSYIGIILLASLCNATAEQRFRFYGLEEAYTVFTLKVAEGFFGYNSPRPQRIWMKGRILV